MEDWFFYPPDPQWAVLHTLRNNSDETFIYYVLLAVYPELNFTLQIMDIFLIGAGG